MTREPDAVAFVALLPSDQGGRAGPTPAEWFGCVVAMNGRNHDVRLRLDRPLQPGAARRVGLYFLDPLTSEGLKAGETFSLWEGHEIGVGRIDQLRKAGPLAAE